jgi:hypothetical protein
MHGQNDVIDPKATLLADAIVTAGEPRRADFRVGTAKTPIAR